MLKIKGLLGCRELSAGSIGGIQISNETTSLTMKTGSGNISLNSRQFDFVKSREWKQVGCRLNGREPRSETYI